jgi:hypothetical protein
MAEAAAKTFYDSAAGISVSGPERQVSWLAQAWLALAGALPQCKAALRTMSDPTALKPLCPYIRRSTLQLGVNETNVGLQLQAYD